MATTEQQLSLLNDFEGRRKPSSELVEKAMNFKTSADSFETHPILMYVVAKNENDVDKMFKPDSSRFESTILFTKMIVRTAVGMSLMLPAIVSRTIRGSQFKHQLQKEYPVEFMVPSPNPEWSRRPVLKKPLEHYAEVLS